MKIRIKGYKFNYKKEYLKYSNLPTIDNPTYQISENISMMKSGKWVQCTLEIVKQDKKWFARIGARSWKENISDLGVLQNNDGLFKTLQINRGTILVIASYNFLYHKKIALCRLNDKRIARKKNLNLILIAIFISTIYYSINHFFNGYLQKLINESNFIQSLIVFLSISSLINIFYPFSIRKEVNIKDVKTINNAAIKEAKEKENRRVSNIIRDCGF